MVLPCHGLNALGGTAWVHIALDVPGGYRNLRQWQGMRSEAGQNLMFLKHAQLQELASH